VEVEILPEPSDEERQAILAALAEAETEEPEDAWARAGLPRRD
jgi:hypothetical protein